MTRHHARRSSALVFEGEPSSVQTPKRRSRKGSDEPKARSRNRRRHPTRHIRRWAADIPEDVEDVEDVENVENVEDPDPPVEILTKKQGKQPESRSKDHAAKDEASKSPVHSESSFETNKTPENVKTESNKAAVNTAEPFEKKRPKSSKAAGQTDAQKAAAARKLPEAKTTDDILGSKASEINAMNPPPVPDPPGSSVSASHPSSVINKPASDMAEHSGPSSSIPGSSGGNKEKDEKDDADVVSVSSLQKVRGLLKKKKK